MSISGRTPSRTREIRWRWPLIVVVLVALCAGCSVTETSAALGDRGFTVASVGSEESDAAGTLRVVAASPPGLPHDAAVVEAERIVWRTHRSELDRIELVLDGTPTTATRPELVARFGPRDPALDGSTVDQDLFDAILVGLAAVLLAAIVVPLVIVGLRRRRVRAGRETPDPLGEATALIGPRAGQFVIDCLVWAVPTFAVGVPVMVATSPPAAWASSLMLAVMAVSMAWGWFAYAYWPSRHDDRTVGMRLLGLRVVALDGTPVGLGRHSLRWLLLGVDTNTNGLVALLAMAVSPRHQRLGDLAASTIVVRARPDGAPPPPSPGPSEALPSAVAEEEHREQRR